MKTTKESKKNTSVPGNPMTVAEFNAFIKEGEKGPFLSEAEYKKEFSEWRKQLKK